jgi:formamidase
VPPARGSEWRRLSVHNRWHPDIEPVLRIRPGEEVTLEARDGLDGQVTPASMHADLLGIDLGRGHPLAGPVHVEGTEPGDLLEVEILAFDPAQFGFTAVIPGFGFLADLFPDPFLVKWEIDVPRPARRSVRESRSRGHRSPGSSASHPRTS